MSTTVETAVLLRIVASPIAGRAGEETPIAGPMTIGREDNNGIIIPEASVSRRHASIEPAPNGALKVTDLSSGNGVYVDNKKIDKVATIAPGQRFRIAGTTFECVRPVIAATVLDAAPVSEHDAPTMFMAAPPAAVAAAAVPPAKAAPRAFIIRVLAGSRKGAEIEVKDGRATLGRSADCTIAFEERDISRKHATIEWTDEGFQITDTNSTMGVWVGKREVKSYLLQPGEKVRLGDTVTIEVVPVAPAVPVVPEPVGRPAPVVEEVNPDATMFVPAKDAAPPPAEPEPVNPDATVFMTPSMVNMPAAVPEPEPVNPDATVFMTPSKVSMLAASATQDMPAVKAPGAPEAKAPPAPAPPKPAAPAAPKATQTKIPKAAPAPKPSEKGVTDDDFSHTVVIHLPDLAKLTAPEAWSIDKEGEASEFHAHKPILLDDAESLWYVASGGVLIFTVQVENGQPVGTRQHFLGIVPGQCFFGFDIASYGLGSGFLAVAKQGTKVRKIKRNRLQQLSKDPKQRAAVAGLVDTWVSGLSSALVRDQTTKRTGELKLTAGARVELKTDTKATAADGVVWVDVTSGSIMFDDMSTPTFSLRRTLFPVTSYSWIQPLSDEFGTMSTTPLDTKQALGDDAAWAGLDVLHQAICESEFISKKLATVDEFVRLQEKAQQSDAAAEAGYDAIGSVLRMDASTPQEFRATGTTDAIMGAVKIVGGALGIEVKDAPASDDDEQRLQLTFEERMAIIASNSGFRTRVVALRDDWWSRDQGPMLGQMAETKQSVALLPSGPKSYKVVNPKDGTEQAVTPRVAETISAFAHQLYRPMPEGQLKVSDVIAFGARGLGSDVRWIVAMAVIVGMFGTVTPYLTGQVFDVAVPQADRGMLYGYGVALLAAAIATSMFKLTQGIATIRMQARMSSTIQSALWDRILNLPVNFFRKYSAGDLADRAAGIDAIQELIAGAGVAAVLGSVSGLFYVGQMFGYDLRLAMIAILLTITYVGFNMLCNYAQLRSQRDEFALRGRIQGLVLNLVTGVSKLRICGAEQHAFRVWATSFAQQRKITFRVGTIQNIASVFGGVFPIVSSIMIFMIVISERQAAAPGGPPGLTTGDFIAFNAAFGLFMMAMQALGDASLSLLRVVPIYERLMPILTTPPEVDKSKSFPGKLTGAIELSHLHFRYDPDGPYIVKDISLKIEPGEFVAFVGESGCGKSTLMRLMLGFEQPSSGTIYFDGQELGSLDLRLVRQQMGVVMQQSRVMPCEIYRNIIGASTRSLEEAWEAAEKSGLADDVRAMPMGMHTYVSEGGGTLSGGQRQRLMIARAIVNKPKIIFLDEATSALDNRTQAIVTESMDKMSATRIVIAHRLSTIQNAHRICYCKAGQIVEMGSFDELMAKNGLFAELAKRQMA
ncbi:MAG TPA: NHLP bacteriocin export ABC transporter permease/ATPase subunit [Vicinamibacterales bacterium]|nr:NHLP bacteriocin export ABC transporter permease/ATPase subunit [Vicinamibacterales bacterium]